MRNNDSSILLCTAEQTQKFPTRRSFADAIVQAWAASGFEIEHWVVSLEAHLNESSECPDEEMNLYRYHMALKLKRRGKMASGSSVSRPEL